MIRFFDDFVSGTGRFEALTGSIQVTTSNQMQINPGSIVATDVLNDDTFQNIVLQVKANDLLAVGGIFSILFYIQDKDNFYEFRANTITRVVSLHKTVATASSQIGADVSVDIVPKASYIFTVTTDFNPSGPDTLLQTFFDSNRIHQIVDASFDKGKFGMKTDGSTTMLVDELEMFERPLDVRIIEPGFDL